MDPREHFVSANGLRHHVLEWGDGERTVVLLHGFLDLAYSFDSVARRLVGRGFRVLAADARGHGETDWVGAGGYYHFADYALDLDTWTTELGITRFDLVGHSMGGTVATMYAGIRPLRVRTLVSIEGLGPIESSVDSAPDRFVNWFEGVERVRKRVPKPIPTLADALERLRVMHPSLPDELGTAIVSRMTKPHASGAGFAWRFDPMHQTQSPMPYRRDLHLACYRRITAPTLAIFGDRGLRVPDEAERLAHIHGARTLELVNCGHMVHWDAPDELAHAVAEHLASNP